MENIKAIMNKQNQSLSLRLDIEILDIQMDVTADTNTVTQ